MANLLISGLCAGVVANNSRIEIQLDGSCVSTRTTAGALNDLITGDITVNACSVSALAANSVDTAEIAALAVETAKIDNDAVTLAKMATGTDGNLISYDTCTNPAFVATGTCGQVLTSNGAGAAPTFQAAAGGGKTFAAVTKASDESVTCSTVLQNDDVIKFAANACKVYFMLMNYIVNSCACNDLKYAWTVPTGATITSTDSNTIIYRTNSVGGMELNGTSAIAAGGDGGCQNVGFIYKVIMCTTAGDVQMQFAQSTSGCVASTMKAGTNMVVWES